jgi:RHS repeat-associated protein
MLAGTAVARERSDPLYGIYAYTGREWDPEISLYYYRARYYEPRVAGFVSEDPIDFKNGMSRYAYVLGNPVGLVDPSGHAAIPNPSPAPPPPATPKLCSCPSYVTDLFHAVCVEKSRHQNAAVRKCLTKRCYLEPITRIVCQDCPRNIGGYAAYGSTQIILCNVSTRSSDCARKRDMFHEMLHTCYPTGEPGGEDWVARMSAGFNGGYYCGGVW